MNKDKQRIAIAEACGYENVHRFNQFLEGRYHREGTIVGDVDGRTKVWVPNYLGDLNAMHEAEEVLGHKDGTKRDYVERLYDVAGTYGAVMATAAQRAEAFLKTLGKWEGA